MLRPDLYNQVIEEVECFKSEYRDIEITREIVRDYLSTTDFNPQQKAVFYEKVGF